MKAGALDGFFTISKPGNRQSRDASTKVFVRAPEKSAESISTTLPNTTPTKRLRSQDKSAPHENLTSPAPMPHRNRVVSNFLRELQAVGDEPRESITIDSSPLGLTVSVPQDSQKTMETVQHRLDSRAEAPPSGPRIVIQKKRALRRGRFPTALPGGEAASRSPSKVAPPIESFFGVSKNRMAARSKNAPKPLSMAAIEPVLPPDLSLGLKVEPAATKKVAIPRDSLPGTWREIDPALIDESSSPRMRGRSRVSYVDLSGS